MRWMENWHTGRAQRVVISGAELSWRLLAGGVSRGQNWVQSHSSHTSVAGSSDRVDCQQICSADDRKLGEVAWSETWTDWSVGQRGT